MIRIDLERDSKFTGGWAHCQVDDDVYDSPKKSSPSPVYTCLAWLVGQGHTGKRFEVHDGRMVVLRGRVRPAHASMRARA